MISDLVALYITVAFAALISALIIQCIVSHGQGG